MAARVVEFTRDSCQKSLRDIPVGDGVQQSDWQ
jgi:hypothetical protein